MTKEFWKAAAIRALKTFAQAMVAQIGAGSIGVVEFDWLGALSVAAMAAVLSIFTSLAGLPEVQLQNTLYALDNDVEEGEELNDDDFDYDFEEEEVDEADIVNVEDEKEGDM